LWSGDALLAIPEDSVFLISPKLFMEKKLLVSQLFCKIPLSFIGSKVQLSCLQNSTTGPHLTQI